MLLTLFPESGADANETPLTRATVTSPAFAGLSRIAQHRLVYGVFGEEIGGPIHALSLTTHSE